MLHSDHLKIAAVGNVYTTVSLQYLVSEAHFCDTVPLYLVT